MSKEAMKLALEALKQIDEAMPFPVAKLAKAALREALAEQPAQGCEFCSHALYAGTKCKNCGREQPAIKQDLTPEQPAQQQPYGYFKAEPFGWTDCAETDEGAIALYEHPQPAQQEPVAWMSDRAVGFKRSEFGATPTVPLYTSPPAQRTWVGLTDEEIERCMKQAYATVQGRNLERAFARAIEAKLRERNGIKGDA